MTVAEHMEHTHTWSAAWPAQVRLVGGSAGDKAPNRSKSLLKQS